MLNALYWLAPLLHPTDQPPALVEADVPAPAATFADACKLTAEQRAQLVPLAMQRARNLHLTGHSPSRRTPCSPVSGSRVSRTACSRSTSFVDGRLGSRAVPVLASGVAAARVSPAGNFDYEAHGGGYTQRRKPDPRIAAMVNKALGPARTVVNVGAGAGSYEPEDRYVAAVEPSVSMRTQRPAHRPPAINATAERLPFDTDSFEAAMAMITIHQWADLDTGLHELRRVSHGPVVILTFDGEALLDFWLNEYVPEVIATERDRFPSIDHVTDALGGRAEVLHVPIPLDCVDGFGEAYYGRPEAFLEAGVRAGQSGWVLTDPAAVARGVERLRRDLESGAWDARHGQLRNQPERTGAVRLIVAHGAKPGSTVDLGGWGAVIGRLWCCC